jgi:hypothetical protein
MLAKDTLKAELKGSPQIMPTQPCCYNKIFGISVLDFSSEIVNLNLV